MEFWDWIKEMVSDEYPGISFSVWNDGMEIPSGIIDWKTARDKDGRTMLHVAAGYGLGPYVKQAISFGININAKANDGSTPLHQLLKCSDLENFQACLKVLLEAGADINTPNRRQNNVLFQAVLEGKSLELLKLLIDSGAKWRDVTSWDCSSILHLAVMNTKNLATLRYFLFEGANVNALNFNDRTPLHQAAIYTSGEAFFETIALLVEKGADVTAVDLYGDSVLLAAAEVPVGVVEQVDGGSTSFSSPIPRKTKAELEFLVKIGCDPKQQNKELQNIVHVVVKGGDWEVLRYFVNELEVDVSQKDIEQRTPLHYCAVMDPNKKLCPIVKLLVEGGADINCEDVDGKTLLDLAETEGRIEKWQIKELVRLGARAVSGVKTRR